MFWCISRTIRCVSTWLKGYKAAVQASSGVVIQVMLCSRHQKPSASSMAYPYRSPHHASRCLREDQGDFRRCGRPMANTRRYGNVHFQDSRFKTYLPTSIVTVSRRTASCLLPRPNISCYGWHTDASSPEMASARRRRGHELYPITWLGHRIEEFHNPRGALWSYGYLPLNTYNAFK